MTTPTTELLTDDEIDACWDRPAPEGTGRIRYEISRAIERALLARLGEQQLAVSTEHGPWLPSTLHDGETYCERCLCRSVFRHAKKCEPHAAPIPSPAPVGAQERDALATWNAVAERSAAQIRDGVKYLLVSEADAVELGGALEAARSAAQGAVQVPADLPQRTFAALQAMTEGILTRGDAQYMRRRLEECVAIMAEHGWQTPTPWPDLLPIKAEFAAPAHAGERQGDSA